MPTLLVILGEVKGGVNKEDSNFFYHLHLFETIFLLDKHDDINSFLIYQSMPPIKTHFYIWSYISTFHSLNINELLCRTFRIAIRESSTR